MNISFIIEDDESIPTDFAATKIKVLMYKMILQSWEIFTLICRLRIHDISVRLSNLKILMMIFEQKSNVTFATCY